MEEKRNEYTRILAAADSMTVQELGKLITDRYRVRSLRPAQKTLVMIQVREPVGESRFWLIRGSSRIFRLFPIWSVKDFGELRRIIRPTVGRTGRIYRSWHSGTDFSAPAAVTITACMRQKALIWETF